MIAIPLWPNLTVPAAAEQLPAPLAFLVITGVAWLGLLLGATLLARAQSRLSRQVRRLRRQLSEAADPPDSP